MFGPSHKTVKIVEPNGPCENGKIREIIDGISDGWDWVTFECEDHDSVIEIARDPEWFEVNIPHGEKIEIVPKIIDSGIPFPSSWTIVKDQKKSFMRTGLLILHLDLDQTAEFASILRPLGETLFGWNSNHAITATYQK